MVSKTDRAGARYHLHRLTENDALNPRRRPATTRSGPTMTCRTCAYDALLDRLPLCKCIAKPSIGAGSAMK